ncbi:MAG: ATP-grasp domain-containing protein [Candidatus Muiribacteriota bacterium]
MLIVIGGGFFQTFALKKAKESGFSTVCVDVNSNAAGKKLADFFLNVSTTDYNTIIKEIKNHNISPDGIITVGTDMSKTVYYVSKEFGLDPGFDNPDTVVNKISMRKRLKEYNIPQPDFIFSDNLKELLFKLKKSALNFPLVLKPAQSMGARGVVKVLSPEDIKKNFKITKKFSSDNRVIIEEYMEGSELSVETIIYKNSMYPLVIGDRNIEKEPYFVETGHSCPSNCSPEVLKESVVLMERASKALGIYNAPAKGDIKLTANGPRIGEIAARLSGGFMSSHTLPLSTGIDGIKIAIKQRLGLKVETMEFFPKFNRVCIERALFKNTKCRIKNILNRQKALEIPGVQYIHYNMEPGDIFSPLKSNIGKIGNIIISGENFIEVEKIYEKALQTLTIETEEV